MSNGNAMSVLPHSGAATVETVQDYHDQCLLFIFYFVLIVVWIEGNGRKGRGMILGIRRIKGHMV